MSSAFLHVFSFKTKTFTHRIFDLMVTLDGKKEAQRLFKYKFTQTNKSSHYLLTLALMQSQIMFCGPQNTANSVAALS